MKRSSFATGLVLIGYLIVFGIIVSAVSDSFGSDSLAMYIVVIALGPVGLFLIGTHKGLDDFLKRLDDQGK